MPVPDSLVRRMRLPPSGASPAAARDAVAALLGAAGLPELRDEALLLTSELVSNGVRHARSELELEILAGIDGVQVTVTDFASVSPVGLAAAMQAELLPAAAPGADTVEGGRGLLLVSSFASRWGVSHDRSGRAVWFQLDRDTTVTRPRPHDQPAPVHPDLTALLRTVLAGSGGDSGDREAATAPSLPELLGRVADALGAATATISVDRADGWGSRVLYRQGGTVGPGGGRTLRVPLPVGRPWTAELIATGVRGAHARTVAELAANSLALLLENQRLTEAHETGRGWLLFLAEAGDLLAQSMNVDLTVALIPRLVVPRLGQWCAIHLINEYGELVPAAITHANEAAAADLALQLDDALAREPYASTVESVVPLGPPTYGLCVPLRLRGSRMGTLTVGRRADAPHSPDELAVVQDLSRRAAVAIDNARVHDQRSRVAATLQRSLLPPELPDIDGLEVAAQYVSAGDELDVGGDFYDLIPVPGNGWMLVVGDVSGKGAGAAAVTGRVRDVLHTLALDHRAPEQTLARLNASLVERGEGYFCTLALAYLHEPSRDGVDLSLHLAGHDKPVLVRANGDTELVGQGGTALGLLNSVSAPRTRVHLGPGDALVFYTDGVTERRRGRLLYGQDRLRQRLASLAGSPASVLAAGVRAAVLDFAPQPPRDDIAIVVVRPPVLSAPEEAPA